MSSLNNTTFIRITNKDIYQKLIDVETHVVKMGGKVKLNRWIGATALTIALLGMGYMTQALELFK